MKQWKANLSYFLKNKIYVWMLALTAVGSFGYLITHETVGIDDTPYAYYFEEGLIAIVGRWVLFTINKFMHISDFSPFIMDLTGVLLLMAAALVWCTLFYEIFGDKVPLWGYVFFSCFLVANPLHSEVFTYYLHNGVGLGYLCCGCSLTVLHRALQYNQNQMKKNQMKKSLLLYAASALLLWVAIGCYESFMVVFVVGFLLMLLSERFAKVKRNVFLALVIGALLCVAGLLLRSLMIPIVTGIFSLQDMQGEAVQRSLGEMFSWISNQDDRDAFVMALKRVYVMYGAFAYAYLPIALFVASAVIIGITSLIHSIRKKEGWAVVLMVGTFFACFLLVLIEGSVTLYRSAQFLPVVCAYGALLLAYGVGKHKAVTNGKLSAISKLLVVLLGICLFEQCYDMNHWFYIDYLKYEDAKNTMNQIAYELEKDYDITKPVIFTGTYELPQTIVQDAFVPYGSPTFYRINRLTGPVDEHLLEKFYRPYGVWVAQTPALSVLDWARYAFDSDEEMAKFFAMHGHKINPCRDIELYAPAEVIALDMPHFPQRGSIEDMGDYIIVHF